MLTKLMISLSTNMRAANVIVTQNNALPNTTDPTNPIDHLNDIVRTLTLQIMTHWANTHMPEETISNMYPSLFIVSSIELKVKTAMKNEKIIGKTNQSDTLRRLNNLLSKPYLYSLGCWSENLLLNFSS